MNLDEYDDACTELKMEADFDASSIACPRAPSISVFRV